MSRGKLTVALGVLAAAAIFGGVALWMKAARRKPGDDASHTSRRAQDTAEKLLPAKLQLSLAASRARPGQLVTLALSIKNTGEKPTFLPRLGWIDHFVFTEVRGPDGKSVHLRHRVLGEKLGKSPRKKLEPGETWIVPFSRSQLPGATGRKFISFAKPGKYVVKCTLEITEDSVSGSPFWRGKVESPEVAVVVKYPMDDDNVPKEVKACLSTLFSAMSNADEQAIERVTTKRGYAALAGSTYRSKGDFLSGLEIQVRENSERKVVLLLGPVVKGFNLEFVREGGTWKLDGFVGGN